MRNSLMPQMAHLPLVIVLLPFVAMAQADGAEPGLPPASEFKAEGVFDKGATGKLVFRSTSHEIEVANAQNVVPTLYGIREVVEGSVAADGKLAVTNVKYQPLVMWDAIQKDMTPEERARTSGLQQQFGELSAIAMKFPTTELTATTQSKDYLAKLETIESEFGRMLADDEHLPGPLRERYLQCALQVMIQRKTGKAYYDTHNDTFKPLTYSTIYTRSRGCAAIARNGGSVFASGVLIGSDLV